MTDPDQSRLRDRLDELEVYVTRIGEATGVPAAHLEKLVLLHHAASEGVA